MASRIIRLALPGWFLSLFLVGLVVCGLFAQRAAAVSDPQAIVSGFYDVLLSNMKNGRMLGESGRYARLAPVVSTTFDVPYMTRLAIGPYWETLSPAQQQQLIAAFAHYIAATYADQFDSYSGQQLQVEGERPFNGDMMVQTRVVDSKGKATRLDYRMHQNRGVWQILDVYLDGTISQLAVHRSEFHSILQREGVDGLVVALNHKVDLLSSLQRS
jgi:phospholipid transport system substrate-binding protein